jgi:hypothetical protein
MSKAKKIESHMKQKIHQKAAAFHADKARNRWIFGGNRTGKTTAGAIEAVAAATGLPAEVITAICAGGGPLAGEATGSTTRSRYCAMRACSEALAALPKGARSAPSGLYGVTSFPIPAGFASLTTSPQGAVSTTHGGERQRGHSGTLAADGWVVSLSTQVQRDVAQRKILEILDAVAAADKSITFECVMQIGSRERASRGIIDFIVVTKTGGQGQTAESRIGFKNCEQGREKFQGTALDWI